MKFSIIVVALNAGDKLLETVDSILSQTYQDYEIIVKDGNSTDGSVEKLQKDERIHLFRERDKSIYDAMNQAVGYAQGDYILFLNCGDRFYDNRVLEHAASVIDREESSEETSGHAGAKTPMVFYGDTYGELNHVMFTAPAKIDSFTCYRNIPCHQACFYAASLCKEKPYDLTYAVRADYDHFLWCYYEAKAKMVYLKETVAVYEGGGFSESKENRKRDREEHRQIVEHYMSAGELAVYRGIMALTLAPVRTYLAENPLTSGMYHRLKQLICRKKKRIVLALICFILELGLFFGSGVMGVEVVNYHSGEGAVELVQDEKSHEFVQTFKPAHSKLESLSFLMEKANVEAEDGSVLLQILDRDKAPVFEKELSFAELQDGRFTDVEVNLNLQAGKHYQLSLTTYPSSLGEYPTIYVCGKEYPLPENKVLYQTGQPTDVQLVSRYCYQDAIPAKKVRNVCVISILTALGILFGLPKNPYIRKTVGIFLMLIAPYILGSRLELLHHNEFLYLPFAMAWNIGIMYGLELVVLLVTHSLGAAVGLTNAFLVVIYCANYFIFDFRGTELRLNDLSAIGTAAEVAGQYQLVPTDHMAMIWGIFVLILVWALQTGGGVPRSLKAMMNWKRVLSFGLTWSVAAVMIWGSGYLFLKTDFFEERGFADKGFKGINESLIYGFDGYLVGSLVDIRKSKIEPPLNYSPERAKMLLEESKAQLGNPAPDSEKDLPHVIYIMNESLADLRVLGNLEMTADNLVFFNSLKENTVRGTVDVSVLGGGTANTEFEALTGCSTAFFSTGFYPYQHAVTHRIDNIVEWLNGYGYTSYSMHPAPRTNWRRGAVYQYLGFDNSLWNKEFAGEERIHAGVSDRATYQKIIELYENRQPGEKLFVFDVTIQNHGDYSLDEAPYAVQAPFVNDTQVDAYLSLVKISDDAFRDLVTYFEKQEEKVVICMFGDHQPFISNSVLKANGEDMGDYEVMLKKYKTPYVIWANYDIDEAEDVNISANYLGGLLLETAGIPLSPYFQYLKELRQDYPSMTLNGYWDSRGNFYQWGDDGTEFLDYRMLQYYLLFDKGRK